MVRAMTDLETERLARNLVEPARDALAEALTPFAHDRPALQ